MTKSLPHQIEGTRFLVERDAAALFDEQGLGKSKQLIDAIATDIDRGRIDGALIVCPNILKDTWASEIERFTTRKYAVFGSGKSARREAFRSLRAAFYIINYEAVAAELPALKALLRFKRCALVLDESHRIKTPDSRVTRTIHALRRFASKRIIMSGTPVANKPEDLWSQLFFLDDGATAGATFEEFCQRFRNGQGYRDLDILKEDMSSQSLRRLKHGTVQLPRKTITRASVQLSGRQLDMYEQMRRELAIWVQSLEGDQVLAEAENILSRLLRLSQLASNPRLLDARYDDSPAKFLTLDGLLADRLHDPSEKVIVWTSYVGNIEPLIARYPKYRPVAIYGAVTDDDRAEVVRLFKTDPDTRLLIANPAAAREGLTLTEARFAIYIDRTFNLVDFVQSQDRIHRLSQTRDCEIVILIAKNSVDEYIDFSLAQKLRLAQYAEGDSNEIAQQDLELRKPDILRALVSPDTQLSE